MSRLLEEPPSPRRSVRRALRNVGANWLSLVVVAVAGFFLPPFIIRHLGDADYGLWTLIVSMTGYMGLMDLGIRTAIVKYVSEFDASGDDLMVNRIVNSSLVLLGGIALVIVLLGAVASLFLPGLLGVSPARWPEVRLVAIIATVTFAIRFALEPLQAIFAGVHRFDVLSGIRIASVLLNAVLIVALLRGAQDLLALSLIALTTALFEAAAASLWLPKLVRHLRLGRRFVDASAFRRLLPYGLYNAGIGVGLRSVAYTDLMLIGLVMGVEHVTFYAVAKTLVGYVQELAGAMAMTLVPEASARGVVRGDLRSLAINGMKASVVIAWPCLLVFLVFGEPFITLWLGPQYAGSSDILRYVALGGLANVPQFALSAVLKGIGRVRFLAVAKLSEAGLHVLLCAALMESYGVAGVAIGAAAATAAINLVVLPAYACRVLGIRLEELAAWLLRPIPAALACVAIVWVFRLDLHVTSWARFALTGGTIAAVFAAGAVSSLLTDREWRALRRRTEALLR